MSKKVRFAIYIGTKNDSFGNPRRAFLVNEIDLSEPKPYPYIIDVVEEGYYGKEALTEAYPDLNPPGYMIYTSPSDYKNFLKIGREKRKEVNEHERKENDSH